MQTDLNKRLDKCSLRELKDIRKYLRCYRTDQHAKIRHEQADFRIKVKQSQPRVSFSPKHINRKAARIHLSTIGRKKK